MEKERTICQMEYHHCSIVFKSIGMSLDETVLLIVHMQDRVVNLNVTEKHCYIKMLRFWLPMPPTLYTARSNELQPGFLQVIAVSSLLPLALPTVKPDPSSTAVNSRNLATKGKINTDGVLSNPLV